MSWYKKSFGHDYLTIYPHRNESEAKKIIRFAVDVLDMKPGQRVLDLACGYGRNSVVCKDYGLNVVGLDLSIDMLALAQNRNRESDKKIPLVRGDMRDIPFVNVFDVVLNLFTSFGYFKTDAENGQVVNAVAGALKPGGLFLFDYLNIMQALTNLTIHDTQVRNDMEIIQERYYDEGTDRIEKKITVHENSEIREYTESVRAYRLIELLRFFKESGLECTAVYGDYDKRAFTENAPRLILVGEKQ